MTDHHLTIIQGRRPVAFEYFDKRRPGENDPASFNWEAHLIGPDADEERDPVGLGPNREQALADLITGLEERDDA